MNYLRNKKTTVLGLSGLVAAAVNFWFSKDLGSLTTALASSIGLLLAQDGGL